MSIYFVETEPSEEAYFLDALPGLDLRFVPALEDVGPDAEILSVFIYSKIDAAFLEAHPRLRYVTTRSTSDDHLDLAALAQRGIAVSHVPGYGETTVAEHTFALILALSRRLREIMAANKSKTRFSYEQTRGFDLMGKTIGIIGMGSIGQRVAALARAFQMTVIAYDVETPDAVASTLGFDFVPLDTLLARSDVISLHARLSEATYHILDHDALARCKPGVLVINTARGALIDTGALRDALDSGIVGGAGLDVLQDERILRDTAAHIIAGDIVKHLRSDAVAHEARDAERVRELQELMLGDAVIQRTNVVFTPHVAFNSREAVARRNQATAGNITAFLEGGPINLITPP